MKKRLLSIDVTIGSYEDFIANLIRLAKSRVSAYVCVANVHMLVEAHRNSAFATIINNADVTTPDGMPLVFGLNALYKINQDRVAGMDLITSLLSEAQNNDIGVYFFGSTDKVLHNIKDRCNRDFPGLILTGTFSPPFRALSEEEQSEIVDNINKSGAGLIFVALGCPKQEMWMASMKGRIHGTMIGVGGAFPVFAGEQTRAPLWMQNYGLEWLFRLVQEPSRLWKRYLITNSIFIFLLARAILSKSILTKSKI